MNNSTTAAIHTHDLTKQFRGHLAVDRLALSVPTGSVFGLVGSNGAGKTTTIKMLLNIIDATTGSATLLGADSRTLGPTEFARIAYVSENQELPEWMTVRQWMDYWKPFYPRWDDAAAAALLRQFDLPPDRKLKHLSRGMKMKAALASSLAYRPELILLDEPFSGLDPLVRDEFIEGLLDRDWETTILISSHDLAEMESFASHIAYMNAGRLDFSEELTSLAARFREVEITLDAAPSLPPNWPSTWLLPDTAAAVVRFVESRFDDARTRAEVQRLFPRARAVSFHPMPLRAIFVAMARAGRVRQAAA